MEIQDRAPCVPGGTPRAPEWATSAVVRVPRTRGVHQARVLYEAPIAENPLPGRSAIDLTETAR